MNRPKFTIHLEYTYPRICGFLIGLALVDELCFNGRGQFVFPAPFLLLLLCEHRSLNLKLHFFWVFAFLIYTDILGIVNIGNDENFSFFYNSAIFINTIFILFLFDQYSTYRILITKWSCIVASIFAGSYLFVNEIDEILIRWGDLVAGKSGYRIGYGSGINANNIAWMFGFIALFCIYMILENKDKSLIGILGLDIVIVFFTGSKNGLILILIPFFYYIICFMLKVNLKKIVLLVILFIILWKMIQDNPILYTLFGKRIDQMFNVFKNSKGSADISLDVSSTLKRLSMIKKAFEMFMQKPVLGWGIGAFALFSGYDYYCHNNYMELLVSGGIIAFLLYYTFLAYTFFKELNQKKNSEHKLAIMLFMSIVILDISTVNFYSRLIFAVRTVLFLSIVWKPEINTKRDNNKYAK